MAHVLSPSTALDFVIKISEKCNCTTPSANQVKNQPNTISTEEKLDVINQPDKGKKIVDTSNNIRFPYSSVYTVSDNAERITESGRTGTKVFV
jgi:hypothetical protein